MAEMVKPKPGCIDCESSVCDECGPAIPPWIPPYKHSKRMQILEELAPLVPLVVFGGLTLVGWLLSWTR